jgi:hypothetical protein
MSKERDLVGEMLPTLCEKYMGCAHFDAEGKVISERLPAEDARLLFDALESLEREQKIRNCRQVLARAGDISEELRKATLARNWKLVTVLATHFFVELTRVTTLEMVALVAVRQKELMDAIGTGEDGVAAFLKFGDHAMGVIKDELIDLLGEARRYGRSDDPRED